MMKKFTANIDCENLVRAFGRLHFDVRGARIGNVLDPVVLIAAKIKCR